MERHRASQRHDAGDVARMRRAIGIAETARMRARPNPWVGAVVVCADGAEFAGATAEPGGPHAEIVAMDAARAAGHDLNGATLYSTLEPCNHHGRTGPCTEAIIAAGITRVFAAIEDPDDKVAGEGLRRLSNAGLFVDVGMCADEVSEQLAPYLHHRRTGRPFVVLKLATTLDARTVAPAGERWITGEPARRRVHEMRAHSDAIIVGSGTVVADDPELTVRHVEGSSPRRVVLSRAGSIAPTARVQPCMVWSSDIPALLDELGADGVIQAMVEGGPTIAGAFHRAGLVDRYVFHVAPIVSGQAGAPGVFGAADRNHPTDVLSDNRLVAANVLGDDIELIYEPLKETAA